MTTSRLTYRDTLRDPSLLPAFEAQVAAEEAAYAAAAEADAALPEPPEEWEDESAVLHRAALNHRGEP